EGGEPLLERTLPAGRGRPGLAGVSGIDRREVVADALQSAVAKVFEPLVVGEEVFADLLLLHEFLAQLLVLDEVLATVLEILEQALADADVDVELGQYVGDRVADSAGTRAGEQQRDHVVVAV